MTRRGNTILDDLTLLPRRINVIPATAVYLSFKYWIQSASFRKPLYKGIASFLGVFIFFVAAISAFNALRKGYIVTETGGV